MAQAACAALDSMKYENIVGTIAGDDTILLILREGITRPQVLETLKTIIPSIDGE